MPALQPAGVGNMLEQQHVGATTCWRSYVLVTERASGLACPRRCVLSEQFTRGAACSPGSELSTVLGSVLAGQRARGAECSRGSVVSRQHDLEAACSRGGVLPGQRAPGAVCSRDGVFSEQLSFVSACFRFQRVLGATCAQCSVPPDPRACGEGYFQYNSLAGVLQRTSKKFSVFIWMFVR